VHVLSDDASRAPHRDSKASSRQIALESEREPMYDMAATARVAPSFAFAPVRLPVNRWRAPIRGGIYCHFLHGSLARIQTRVAFYSYEWAKSRQNLFKEKSSCGAFSGWGPAMWPRFVTASFWCTQGQCQRLGSFHEFWTRRVYACSDSNGVTILNLFAVKPPPDLIKKFLARIGSGVPAEQ